MPRICCPGNATVDPYSWSIISPHIPYLVEIYFDRICSSQDDRSLGEIFVQAFNTSPKEEQIYRDRLGAESFRLLRRDRKILGGLGIYDMGQWWGERAVPMAG